MMEDCLFELTSLYRLGPTVRERTLKEVGRRISPNTMNLALKDETASTELRKEIRRIALEAINQHREVVAALRRLETQTDARLKAQMEEMGHGHAAMLVS